MMSSRLHGGKEGIVRRNKLGTQGQSSFPPRLQALEPESPSRPRVSEDVRFGYSSCANVSARKTIDIITGLTTPKISLLKSFKAAYLAILQWAL